MRSANPALNANSFANLAVGLGDTDRMSLQGTVIKSMGLLLLVVAAASWSWKLYFTSGAGAEASQAFSRDRAPAGTRSC